MHRRTRSQRFALLQQQVHATGLSVRDPARITRIALLDLEHQELTELAKGVMHPAEYYDMPLLLFDSPSQHSTPCTPMPFIPPASPLVYSAGVTPFASPEAHPRYMQYPSPSASPPAPLPSASPPVILPPALQFPGLQPALFPARATGSVVQN
jgi:hypothetical protein